MKTKKCHCCHGTGTEHDAKVHGRAMSGLRLRAGIGLRAMAKRLNVSHTYLWQMEQGRRRWPDALNRKYRSLVMRELP